MSAKLKPLAKLTDLDRVELIDRWHDLYNKMPPVGISRPLLLRAVAYKMQEQGLSSLKPVTKAFLTKAAADMLSGRQQLTIPSPAIKPGTRLLREWHGITYEVMILENSVMYKGTQYRSLTEVAEIITGAKWSGPRFFGLKPGKLKEII